MGSSLKMPWRRIQVPLLIKHGLAIILQPGDCWLFQHGRPRPTVWRDRINLMGYSGAELELTVSTSQGEGSSDSMHIPFTPNGPLVRSIGNTSWSIGHRHQAIMYRVSSIMVNRKNWQKITDWKPWQLGFDTELELTGESQLLCSEGGYSIVKGVMSWRWLSVAGRMLGRGRDAW